ncbi:hypothetical protein RHMOL_Rhmol09G0037400 [Rhododendron molle]|uniref:Uncharacterized protein n=2 Tax=Rhododendron molle TaxID=49168 RepID=A0ACC0MAJ2_RHOML|nr:hypothetical protein RHMOL_Rhmol09G0037400 [Rhododendron molle]KAI8537610.1 hypothetical protein RHMOL_Rhmol09G0037400 [Rhododendron molle]
MACLLLSNPSLSSPFLAKKLSISANSKSPSTVRVLSFRSSRCVGDSHYEGNTPTFPRINVQDPYRRLGVSIDASEKEIWSSRNFLLAQYAPHERSAESIELAFEKLLMDSFVRTKKRKINLKSMLKKQVQESPPWFKNLLGFVEVPPTVIILRRLFLFAFIAGWSIMNSAETGPAFQVAISLGACIYFLNGKKKSLAKASMIGLGLLVAGWICGSFLVPAIPAALLHPSWTLELITSLVAYVFLFLGCTFLK